MATKQDLDFTYSTIDKIFRLSFGEMADYSGARFDGNFALTVEEEFENIGRAVRGVYGVGGIPDHTLFQDGLRQARPSRASRRQRRGS